MAGAYNLLLVRVLPRLHALSPIRHRTILALSVSEGPKAGRQGQTARTPVKRHQPLRPPQPKSASSAIVCAECHIGTSLLKITFLSRQHKYQQTFRHSFIHATCSFHNTLRSLLPASHFFPPQTFLAFAGRPPLIPTTSFLIVQIVVVTILVTPV